MEGGEAGVVAVTKVFAIRVRLDDRVCYITDGEKTSLASSITYISNPEKTEQFFFTSALNCSSVDTALSEMMETKQQFGKMGGVLGYHFIQSFQPGEVTPEQAHAIGLEFAKRLFGKRYEVVISTHLNKHHLHNHLVVNSVSCVDGQKYHSNPESYYNDVRGTSDELCRENDLSVITPQGKGKHYAEWKAEQGGKPTVRGIIRADIDTIIGQAYTYDMPSRRLPRRNASSPVVRAKSYTTDSDGVIYLPEAESGWYTVTELEAASGYLLDTTPHRIEVKDGQTATLEITNHKSSRILLHKVDKATGKGIYGAVFLLYDSNHNPIGEYATDQDGYIYADEGLADGRYYLREIKAAPGYVLDPELKTIYVRYGSTTEIEWSNTAECGQIQIIKKSADDNATNGLPVGTLLEGAVFEIYDKAGNVVDTIKSDRNGRAVSKTLPLSRYTVREIKAPANYSINPTVMTAYLEFNGQIVTFEVQNTSVSTGVSIKKTGPVQAVPGQPIRYVFSQIKNSSNVALDSFYWRDQLPAQVTLSKIVTGSYNQPLSYKVVYKTNLSGDYRTLADNLSTSKVYVLDARPAVLGLAANERVTEVMFVFGNVKAGFAQVETPYIYATARSGLANNASVVNVADVGGLYNGQWIQAVSRWLTTVYTKTTVKLPKTGY